MVVTKLKNEVLDWCQTTLDVKPDDDEIFKVNSFLLSSIMNARISAVGLCVILRYLCLNKRVLFTRLNCALGFYRKRRVGNNFYIYGIKEFIQ